MNILEERIIKDGVVKPNNILKVDSFLNHQIDPNLLSELAKTLKEYFADKGITKVLTIEASGIALGIMVAQQFDVPLLFAKKAKSANLDSDLYSSTVKSYTYNREYSMIASKKFINSDDTVLIVDDFLAEGNAAYGLIDIAHQAGAKVAGIGIAIEKGFQDGGKRLRADGYDLLSLSIVEEFDGDKIVFR